MSVPLDSLPGEPPVPARLRIDISPGRMLLVIGPSTLRYFMTRLIVSLAAARPVRVLDAGSQFEASLLDQLAAGRKRLLDRIDLTPIATSRRLFTQLENILVQSGPVVVLDLLHPFYDTSILLTERKALLDGCLEQLRRFKAGGGAVSLCPPKRHTASARSLFRVVEQRSPGVFTARLTLPGPELGRLYLKDPPG